MIGVRRPWMLIIVLGWTMLLSVSLADRLTPASAFYEVRSVLIEDTVAGVAPIMHFDRVIHRNFKGSWIAKVERASARGGWTQTCGAVGSTNYVTDAELPDPLTLDWWTFPERCTPDVPGIYRVVTTWTIHMPGGLEKDVWSVSNSFKVSEQ